MSDMAKQARAAMKAKAKSLTSADPHQKVDSSTWTPPEPLNADVKTGLRPLSRRAFKAGGKVQGQKAKANLGKATRGGNKPITPDTMANKDVKAANMDRPGIKHVGGMKKGGVACKNNGGGLSIEEIIEKDKSVPAKNPGPMTKDEAGIKSGPMNKGNAAAFDKEQQEYQRKMPMNRKAGGRAKKAGGGADLSDYGAGVAGAAQMMQKAQNRAGVPQGLYGSGFSKVQRGSLSPLKAAGMKKGGEAKHDDEAEDKALIKKMVKPEARTGRKSGGRAKGKTNINIVIAAGKPADQGMGMPGGPTKPPGMDAGLGGVPVPVPPPQAGGSMPAAVPMPMPMPAAGGAPPMPTPKRDGGRLTKVAKSYKDMEAGAASGEGRLQKTDMAKRIPKPTENGAKAFTGLGYPNKVPGATGGRTARKAGGRSYRSYKDMDAGAGGGEGRLEKAEIQAHKG